MRILFILVKLLDIKPTLLVTLTEIFKDSLIEKYGEPDEYEKVKLSGLADYSGDEDALQSDLIGFRAKS